MLAGIKEVLIISTPQDISRFEELLGNGSHLGMKFSYATQPLPNGLAEAFIIGEDFIGDDTVCLILGDNIFFGYQFSKALKPAANITSGAIVFGYYVNDPERYGVVEFNEDGKVLNLVEKPEHPKSHYAVTGLYFYDNTVVEKAKSLKPSPRGELEITDLNKLYLEEGTLEVNLMGRGMAWLDTGTHKSLMEASNFISTIEQRQGLKVACIEEIAFRKGYINAEQLHKLALPLAKNQYGEYLLNLLKDPQINLEDDID
jgi:glucose-1-phosphate thymidylyltransferase